MLIRQCCPCSLARVTPRRLALVILHRPVAGLCRRGGRGSWAAAGPGQLRGSCSSKTGGCTSGEPRALLRGGLPVGIGRRQERQQRRRLAERGARADHRDQAPVQHCLPRCHHLRCQPACIAQSANRAITQTYRTSPLMFWPGPFHLLWTPVCPVWVDLRPVCKSMQSGSSAVQLWMHLCKQIHTERSYNSSLRTLRCICHKTVLPVKLCMCSFPAEG